MFSDDVLYNIFSYIEDIDLSCLVTEPTYKSALTYNYKKYHASAFVNFIAEHFSRLFFLNAIKRPAHIMDIHSIFSTLDYRGTFQDPYYYELVTYIQVFKSFDEYAIGSYVAQCSYPDYVSRTQHLFRNPTQKISIVIVVLYMC